MSKSPNIPQTSIKLSLRGVFLAVFVMLVIGALGGILGAQLITPPLPPLTDEQKPFVATVQEVTISPSRAAADLVTTHERAILLLGEVGTNTIQFQGTGIVLTNDGLVVSTENISGQVTAFDNTGRRVALNKVGEDALYGLTYYRLDNSVIPPFQLADGDTAVGSTVLAITRSNDTLAPKAVHWQALEYITPEAETPAAWLRVLRITSTADTNLAEFEGAPLIADDGALTGLVVDASAGTAISVSDIRASLQRVTAGQREADPFATWGMSLAYGFTYNDDLSQRQFTASVSAVAPNSPAATARLVAGDTITRINETEITWTANIVQLLSGNEPLQLSIIRNGQPQTITLTRSAPSPQ